MRIKIQTIPLAVSLTVVCLVTAILWYFKRSGMGPVHPVFFYLLPIALLTILYGRLPALVCASVAMLCSAFFLYDPVYSFPRKQSAGSRRFSLFRCVGLDRRSNHRRAIAPAHKRLSGEIALPKTLSVVGLRCQDQIRLQIRIASPADPRP